MASHTGKFESPWEGGGRGRGLEALPKTQCAVMLAQSGNWSKSNMTRPQVLMARNTQVIPMTFIISPVFIWKRTRSKLAPLGLPGCQNKGEWDTGVRALEKGTKAVGWASRPQARLCPSTHPQAEKLHVQNKSSLLKAAWETGRTGRLSRPTGTPGNLGLREASELLRSPGPGLTPVPSPSRKCTPAFPEPELPSLHGHESLPSKPVADFSLGIRIEPAVPGFWDCPLCENAPWSPKDTQGWC